MKKLLILFVAAGMALFSGCQGDDGQDAVNIEARTFELQNVNFGFSNQEYTIYRTLNPTILDSDSILIYRLSGTIDSQTPIWQLIPRTLFFPGIGELDYDYDFSLEDFTIYAGGTYDLTQTPEYLNNQTFRIVAIPGYFSTSKNGSGNSPTVDFTDYNAVVKAYGLENQPIIQL